MHLLDLVVFENDFADRGHVVLAFLGRAFQGAVRYGDPPTGSAPPEDLDVVSADRLDQLHVLVGQIEDAAVVVVQDHDGGQERGHQLDVGVDVGRLLYGRSADAARRRRRSVGSGDDHRQS